jgi:hypothetical protein
LLELNVWLKCTPGCSKNLGDFKIKDNFLLLIGTPMSHILSRAYSAIPLLGKPILVTSEANNLTKMSQVKDINFVSIRFGDFYHNSFARKKVASGNFCSFYQENQAVDGNSVVANLFQPPVTTSDGHRCGRSPPFPLPLPCSVLSPTPCGVQ